MYKNWLFDLDDTLLVCGEYYVKCKNIFIDVAHQRTQIEKSIILDILHGIDKSCMNMQHGFAKHRFPRSFAATSAVLDMVQGNKIDEEAAERAFAIGDSVFRAPYVPIPGSIETLKWLRDEGANVFIVTKGDFEIQQNKLEKNGLFEYIDRDKVYIDTTKNVTHFEKVMVDFSLQKEETIVVGDSIKDDIKSASILGLDSIWVAGEQDKSWIETDINSKIYTNYTVVETVGEIPSLMIIGYSINSKRGKL